MHDDTFHLTSGCFAENQRFGFINKTGDLVINPRFFVARDFSEGLSAVRVEESATSKFAFIDKTGKVVIPAEFDQADSFSEGLAAIQTGFRSEGGRQVAGKWGFINTSGNLVITTQFELAVDFSEGLARACDEVGNWGFVDHRGRFAIPQVHLSDRFL